MNLLQKYQDKVNWLLSPLTKPVSAGSYLRWFTGVVAAVFLLCIAAVWFVDPHIYFHKAIGLKQVFDNSQAMIPGIMRHYDYDAIMFGSSMTQNFNIREINHIFGVKSIKATTAGLSGDTFDQYFRFAKKCNPDGLKRCFIGVDIFSFAKIGEQLWEPYDHLYGDSFFPAEYFFSTDTLGDMFDAVIANCTAGRNPVARQQLDFYQMFCNRIGKFRYSRESMEWSIRCMDQLPKAPDKSTRQNFEKQLLSHIRENPQIKFDLFLPPYSIYFWCFQKKLGHLDEYSALRNFLAEEVGKLPNAVLHDLQAEWDIVCNLDNYKDITHYSPAINSEILRNIHSGKYISSGIQVKKSTNLIRKKLEEYDAAFLSLYGNKPSRKK